MTTGIRILASALLLIGSPIHASADTPSRRPHLGEKKLHYSVSSTRYLGFEIELNQDAFRNVLPYFDMNHPQLTQQFERLRSKSKYHPGTLNEETLADYLESTQALQTLPRNLYQKLTHGLDLSVPDLSTGNPMLMDSKGNALTPEAGRLQVPDQGIKPVTVIATQKVKTPALPEKPPIPGEAGMVKLQNGIYLDRASQWKILRERWDALPYLEKLDVVQFQHFPAHQQAQIILQHDLHFNHAILKQNAPDVFKKLSWHKDYKSMEFKLTTPTSSPQELGKHLHQFAEAANISYELAHPEKAIRKDNFSFHLHYSRAGIDPVLVEKYNFLQALKIFHQGPHREVVLQRSPDRWMPALNSYHTDLGATGVVRMFEDGHFEVREHTASPAQELEELERYFASPDPAKAASVLDQEIEQRLTPEVLSALTFRYTFDDFDHFTRFLNLPRETWASWGRMMPSFNQRLHFLEAYAREKGPQEGHALIPELLDEFFSHPEKVPADELSDFIATLRRIKNPKLSEPLLDLALRQPRLLFQPEMKEFMKPFLSTTAKDALSLRIQKAVNTPETYLPLITELNSEFDDRLANQLFSRLIEFERKKSGKKSVIESLLKKAGLKPGDPLLKHLSDDRLLGEYLYHFVPHFCTPGNTYRKIIW